MRPSLNRRLVSRIVWATEPDGCMEWKGAHTPRGYGQIYMGERMVPVHRVIYEICRGPIAPGLVIDHLCRNTGCLNPDHLEPVTTRENVLRGVGRSAINSRKTHCIWGHPLKGDNLVYSKTCRRCKACERLRLARRRRMAGRRERKRRGAT